MRLAHFDPFAGASGDMVLGAIVDAGWPFERLEWLVRQLDLPGTAVVRETVFKHGIRGTLIRVVPADQAVAVMQPVRGLRELLRLIAGVPIPARARADAEGVLTRLGEVEAAIHGTTLADVHFHEIGAVDTVVDVLGAVVGLAELHVERVTAGPLPIGRGFVRTAHGPLPVPPPAVAALTVGVPTRGSAIEGEQVTPTGAAILTTLAVAWGDQPAMTVRAVGYGAGQRDFPIPNLLRVFVGDAEEPGGDAALVLETNIDDMNPELFDFVSARLFAAGALDVWTVPIGMKKGRPATQLAVLCAPARADELVDLIFRETTTFGVRRREVHRDRLERRLVDVRTPFGPIKVKLGYRHGQLITASPEYESCRVAAEAAGVPLKAVFSAAQRAADSLLDGSA